MTEEAKFECTDMFLMNSLHDLYTSMQFEDQRILTKTHLKNNFTISKERSSSEDEHKEMLEEGLKFLENSEVGDLFRWQVDMITLQYCEIRRIS
tara:strand:+ start:156 stop:437 length:282 start_codon:yes stop_codon:yes gene_type:complete